MHLFSPISGRRGRKAPVVDRTGCTYTSCYSSTMFPGSRWRACIWFLHLFSPNGWYTINEKSGCILLGPGARGFGEGPDLIEFRWKKQRFKWSFERILKEEEGGDHVKSVSAITATLWWWSPNLRQSVSSSCIYYYHYSRPTGGGLSLRNPHDGRIGIS